MQVNGPVLEEEEIHVEFVVTPTPIIMTSKIMMGGVEYEPHAAKKTELDTAG